jgi:hypothetical protein
MSKALAQFRDWIRSSAGGFDTGSLTLAERSRYHTYYQAARERLDGAMQLGAASKSVPAILLFREGFTMLANAHVIGIGGQPSDDPTALLRSFAASVAADCPAGAQLLRDDLLTTSNESTAVDLLDDRERRVRVVELSSLAGRLMRKMSPQTPRERRKWRVLRHVSVAMAMAVSLALIAADLRAPENIALHKNATSSGSAYGTKPSGAVDGRAYKGRFGFHSDSGPTSWLRVDLGRDYDITGARIFGRHDCCFDQSIPMGLEVSDDGQVFTLVAEKRNAFDQVDPWEINLNYVRARYVRVRRLEPGELVLSEVEVFGKSR